jgi:hypothetical protein
MSYRESGRPLLVRPVCLFLEIVLLILQKTLLTRGDVTFLTCELYRYEGVGGCVRVSREGFPQ